MNPNKVIKLALGTILYSYTDFRNVVSFEVKEKREDKYGVSYVVEADTSCDYKGHWLIIAQMDNCKRFRYVSMYNDDSEFDGHHNYFMYDKAEYFLDKEECLKAMRNKWREWKQEEIDGLEKRLKTLKEEIANLDFIIQDRNRFDVIRFVPVEQYREKREWLGLTLEEVEAATGIHKGQLSKLETGSIKKPAYATILKLSEFYNKDEI